MASGLFSGSGTKKRNGSLLEGSVEDQINELRDEISALAKILSQRGADASKDMRARAAEASKDVRSKAHDAREHAEAGLHDLISQGETLLAELRGQYAVTEKQVRRTVREHPVATLGAAAAIGLLIAALIRR